MSEEDLFDKIIDEFNLQNIILDDNKQEIMNEYIPLLKKKAESFSDFNFKMILTVMLLLLNRMKEIRFESNPPVVVLTASVLWHNAINRPNDREYILQDEIEKRFDASINAERFLRRELGINKRVYSDLESLIEDLNKGSNIILGNLFTSQNFRKWDEIRNFLIEKVFKRENFNQCALEAAIFLYLNRERTYTKSEIWNATKHDILLEGDTPEATFNSDLSRYTINSDVKSKRKPLLFEIVNPDEQPHKIVILDNIFEEINRFLMDIAELIKPFVEFSKLLEETDENVRQICNIIRESEREYINAYYNNFFQVRIPLEKNISPFFRILTINKICKSNRRNNPFNSLADFINYVDEFKDKLKDDSFPDNFIDDILELNDIEPIIYEGKEYHFNLDFVRKFVKVTESVDRQFQNYGGFNFFRHFIIYYTPQGIKLKEAHSNLWNMIFNPIIKLLNLESEEYFVDHGRFFMPKGVYEDDRTWGALLKSNIGNLEIEEHRTRSLQLYIGINPKGLEIGTNLGSNADIALKTFLEENAIENKDKLINLFKEFKVKYQDNIRIISSERDVEKLINLDQSLEDDSFKEEIFDYFKRQFSIIYGEFQGDQTQFNYIVKDLFEVYKILIGESEIEPLPPISPLKELITNNVQTTNFLSAKDDIVKYLNKEFVGIDLNNIVEKILNLLESEKNIILYGAPGTGKTVILEDIFKILKEKFDVIEDILSTTATSDWTLFETIGGLVPEAKKLNFRPGLFLRCFRKPGTKISNNWLIVDELNRANIDKAFGYFFTSLSDESVELPFKNLDDQTIRLVPIKKYMHEGKNIDEIFDLINSGTRGFDTYYISPNWRMGGTINSSDKASLHQLSHAFIRRFGFVNIPSPDIEKFMKDFKNFESSEKKQNDLKKVWEIIQEIYEIGPAIIIDMDKLLKSDNLDIFDAFEAYILPQIDTLPDDIINNLMEKLIKEFGEERGKRFSEYKVIL